MCGFGREEGFDANTVGQGFPGLGTGRLGSLLDALRRRREEAEEEANRVDLSDPFQPHGGTLLRPTPTATRVGLAPGVARRRFRARTLGIRQLGVPLPGPLQGGLELPDFD